VLFIREIDLDKSERILAILFEKEVSRTVFLFFIGHEVLFYETTFSASALEH
jgi:hypothetical protein